MKCARNLFKSLLAAGLILGVMILAQSVDAKTCPTGQDFGTTIFSKWHDCKCPSGYTKKYTDQVTKAKAVCMKTDAGGAVVCPSGQFNTTGRWHDCNCPSGSIKKYTNVSKSDAVCLPADASGKALCPIGQDFSTLATTTYHDCNCPSGYVKRYTDQTTKAKAVCMKTDASGNVMCPTGTFNTTGRWHDCKCPSGHTKNYQDKVPYLKTKDEAVCLQTAAKVCGSETDKDNDGIPDVLEDSLARKYAPLVRLASTDWTRPANVDWYLSRVHMRFNHTRCPDCEVLAKGKVTQANMHQQSHETKTDVICKHTGTKQYSNKSDKFFLQPPNDDVHKGSSNQGDWRVYVHVNKTRAGGYYVQYWFFYPYNDWEGILKHEGDWEHISITLDAKQNPIRAYYAAHGTGEHHNWKDLEKVNESGQKDANGTHPVVYSAKGSHASYKTPGEHWIKNDLTKNIPVKDYTHRDGPAWPTWNNLINIGEKNCSLNGQEFILYGGKWGEIGAASAIGVGDTSGPVGPAFKNDFLDETK